MTSNVSKLVTPACVAATMAACLVAMAQDGTQLFTARELFYSVADAPKAAPKAVPKAPPKRPANPTVAIAQPKTDPPSRPLNARPLSTTPDGTPLLAVADNMPSSAPAPATGSPLGLKYTILKRSGDEDVEVPTDTVFHAGDRIRFSVQTNGPGYLYIISQGSSGTWKPIFPSPEVADGNNHVDGWHSYMMPPKSRMVFDEQTGTEKLFLVFSREPEPDLEKMIYSLQGGKAKPVSQPEAPAAPKQMLVMASLNINDAAVNQLRSTYRRDLIIEKVDENTPGDKKEKAVYVVNPTGSSASRIVADLQLVHK